MKIILFFPGPFHVAWYPLWEFSKTGRKDREREGTRDDGITHINISIPVPKIVPKITPRVS